MVAGLGGVIFILGALMNLSAVGAAAAGNLLFAGSYYGPGFAVELVSFAILGVGVRMKGKDGQHARGTAGRITMKNPTSDSRD